MNLLLATVACLPNAELVKKEGGLILYLQKLYIWLLRPLIFKIKNGSTHLFIQSLYNFSTNFGRNFR